MASSLVMDKIFSFFEGESATLQAVGRMGFTIYNEREMIQMYIHLILAALFPIYIGSHASLRRPPSAKSPKKSKVEDGDEDDDIDVEPTVEGLSPSDAVMFPVLAGITLTLLYFIIKWLKDPALLNKILGWYFSILGIFGVGRLAADTLNVATTFIFPSVWSGNGRTYYVDPPLSQQLSGSVKPARTQVHRNFVEGKTTPLPGILSTLKFSEATTRALWSLRALLKNHWIFRAYLHGIFGLKSKVQFNDVLGYLFGIAIVILYNLNGRAWWLTNLIGFGFCYGTFQLISPTTFWTGSLVLTGLFIYDITMVFYTPLMVTVATSLDVPIKLVFPGPKRGGMLGLGDVVLPGIMMALGLRFDLYLHYRRKRADSDDDTTLSATSASAMKRIGMTTKAPYIEATGHWGERFWTLGANDEDRPTAVQGVRFSKVYFKASLVGYVLGMLVTLVVLNVYNHAQPALLYLVPGVLFALWGTALVRGELKTMWNYTEDGSLEDDSEDEEKSKEKTALEQSSDIPESGAMGSSTGISMGSSNTTQLDTNRAGTKKTGLEGKGNHDHPVFLFSLSAPELRASNMKKLL